MEIRASIHSLRENVSRVVAALPHQLPFGSIRDVFHRIPVRITHQFSRHVRTSESERVRVAETTPRTEGTDICKSVSKGIRTVSNIPIVIVNRLLDAHFPFMVFLIRTFPRENRFRIAISAFHFSLVTRVNKLK